MLRFLLSLLLFCSVLGAGAQAALQSGVAKTRGRLASDGKVIAGKPLQGVIIKVRGSNETQSGADGSFSFRADKSFMFERASKAGYVLADADFLKRTHQRTSARLFVVLDDEKQRQDDINAATRKIRRTMRAQLQAKEDSLDAMREQLRITEEKYQAELEAIYAAQEADEKYISDMARRYASTDWDEVDDFQRSVNALILNGELSRADSMLNSRGNREAAIAARREAKAAAERRQEELDRQQARLDEARAQIEREDRADADWCFSKFELHKLMHRNDSAAYYLRLRLEIDPTRLDWLVHAKDFMTTYLADYPEAEILAGRIVETASKNYGNPSLELAEAYNHRGMARYNLENFDGADADYREALKIYRAGGYNTKLDYSIGINIATILSDRNRPAEALSIVRPLFDRAVAEGDLISAAIFSNSLTAIYLALSRYDKALQFAKVDLEQKEKAYGDKSPMLATPLNNLAVIYEDLGRNEEALAMLERALAILIENYGEIHPQVGQLYGVTARLHHNADRYDEALKYYDKAIGVLSRCHASELALALQYLNSGLTYSRLTQYDKAIAQVEKGREIYRRIQGEDNADEALALSYLGTIYSNMGNLEKSAEMHAKALAMHERAFGESNTHTAADLNNLASVYSDQGRYDEAESLYRRAIGIANNIYGPGNSSEATYLGNIGHLYSLRGDFATARSYTERSYTMLDSLYPGDKFEKAVAMSSLAVFCEKAGDYERSLDLAQKALGMRQRLLPPDHPELAVSYNNIGATCFGMGRYDEALANYNKALEICRKSLPPMHLRTCDILVNIAVLNYNGGNYEAYEKAAKEAIAIYGHNFGDNCMQASGLKLHLGNYYTHTNRYAEAEPLIKSWLDTNGENTNDRESLANALVSMGFCRLTGARDHAGAREYFGKAAAVSEEVFGPNSANTAFTYSILASTCYSTGDFRGCLDAYQRTFDIGKSLPPGTIKNQGYMIMQTADCYFRLGDNAGYRDFTADKVYRGTVAGPDTAAALKGWSGSYTALQFGDWTADSDYPITEAIARHQGKPKHVKLLADNGTVVEGDFDNMVGIQFELQQSTKDMRNKLSEILKNLKK